MIVAHIDGVQEVKSKCVDDVWEKASKNVFIKQSKNINTAITYSTSNSSIVPKR